MKLISLLFFAVVGIAGCGQPPPNHNVDDDEEDNNNNNNGCVACTPIGAVEDSAGAYVDGQLQTWRSRSVVNQMPGLPGSYYVDATDGDTILLLTAVYTVDPPVTVSCVPDGFGAAGIRYDDLDGPDYIATNGNDGPIGECEIHIEVAEGSGGRFAGRFGGVLVSENGDAITLELGVFDFEVD